MFSRKETPNEVRERVLSLCEDVDCGIFSPPLNAQVALNELARHLLGEDWYSTNPISQEQINAEIVYEIEMKYRKRVKR